MNDSQIIDPTIRFEHHTNQPAEVNAEKQNIYNPTIPYYKSQYYLQDITVIGLMRVPREAKLGQCNGIEKWIFTGRKLNMTEGLGIFSN
ncbi:hypothetical protein C0J52_27667 [Blattella germanica]|nr:hypothetical protein C0J52_27667 [Blattella germanica]